VCAYANTTARFLPQTSEDTLPCLELTGVQVYAYLDPEIGAFRVSVDLDTAAPALHRADFTIPVRVDVGDVIVFDDSSQARAAEAASGADGVVLTREQLEGWTGRPLDAGEVAWLDEQIPNSSIPAAIGQIVTQLGGEAD
jgi:hypothetical protein